MTLPSLPGLPGLPALPEPQGGLPDPSALPGLPGFPSLPEPAAGPAARRSGSLCNRTDLYWDGVWPVSSQAVWSTGEDLRARLASGVTRRTRLSVMDRDEAETVFTERTGRDRRLGLASLLDSWGTVSAEQARDFTGHRQLTKVTDRSVSAMFSCGILDIGLLTSSMSAASADPASVLYRTGDAGAARRRFAPTHSTVELWQIDGGITDAPKGGYFDRHNVLAAELALRSVEENPAVVTCFGEKYASSEMLFPADYRRHRAGSGYVLGQRRSNPARGDGCLVLQNGVRVVIEITATSSSASFRRKVSRWAEVLDRHPLDASGLVVLFVAAPHPGRDGHPPTSNVTKIKADITEALKKHNPAGPDSAHARIAVASWWDFFPARHTVAEAFTDLTVLVPQRGWHQVSLVHEMAPRQGADLARGALQSSQVLGATPWWLRQDEVTELVGGLPSARSALPFPQIPSTADPSVPARTRNTVMPPRLKLLAHRGPDTRGGSRHR